MTALAGIRILDLTQMLAGPYGSLILADLGAEVIKIEPPDGDKKRTLGGEAKVGHEDVGFYALNRNKRGVVLDLKVPAAREVFLDLVRVSDVVLDNFRPGVMDRLGLGYETLSRVNPRIIGCSVSGYGATGPMRDYPSYDLVVQALAGAMSMTGEPGRPPVRMGLPVADLAGGIFAAHGIMAALLARHRTGRGQQVDVALLDSLVSMLVYYTSRYFAEGRSEGPVGSGHPSLVPYQAFRARDRHFVVAVPTNRFWERLCRAIDREDLIDDPRFRTNDDRAAHREQLVPLLERTFAGQDAAHWVERLRRAGIPTAPVNDLEGALHEPQVRARGMVVFQEHPTGMRIGMSGNPIKLSHTPGETFVLAPLLAEHTGEVLGGLLGYAPDRIRALEAAGAIRCRP
jgi:crotonobetainyl-CoA:carnitine CoA-transferase CaiB-like acyl-CoA transferase